jgi:curved DNA-binding protein CbpA
LPAPESPWETLGLEPGAAFAEIESAYRKKAKLCHPDHGGSHEQMARLNAARSELLRRTA